MPVHTFSTLPHLRYLILVAACVARIYYFSSELRCGVVCSLQVFSMTCLVRGIVATLASHNVYSVWAGAFASQPISTQFPTQLYPAPLQHLLCGPSWAVSGWRWVGVQISSATFPTHNCVPLFSCHSLMALFACRSSPISVWGAQISVAGGPRTGSSTD